MDSAGKVSPEEKILASAAKELAERFGTVVEAAKKGSPQAEAKLRHFESAAARGPDGEALGVKLATMNRSQRRAYLSDVRKAAKRAKKRRPPAPAPAAVIAEGKNSIIAFGGMGPEDADFEDLEFVNGGDKGPDRGGLG